MHQEAHKPVYKTEQTEYEKEKRDKDINENTKDNIQQKQNKYK